MAYPQQQYPPGYMPPASPPPPPPQQYGYGSYPPQQQQQYGSWPPQQQQQQAAPTEQQEGVVVAQQIPVGTLDQQRAENNAARKWCGVDKGCCIYVLIFTLSVLFTIGLIFVLLAVFGK